MIENGRYVIYALCKDEEMIGHPLKPETRVSDGELEPERQRPVVFCAAADLGPVLAGEGRPGTISKSPSRCFRISTLARWGSRRNTSSSRSSLVMTHAGCTRGGGATGLNLLIGGLGTGWTRPRC